MPAIAPSVVSNTQSLPVTCSAVGTVVEVVGDSVVVEVVGDSMVVVGAADVVGAALLSVDSASPSALLVAGTSVVGGASATSSSAPPHADARRARAVIETSNRVIRFIGVLPSGGVDTVQIIDTDAEDSFVDVLVRALAHARRRDGAAPEGAAPLRICCPAGKRPALGELTLGRHRSCWSAGSLPRTGRRWRWGDDPRCSPSDPAQPATGCGSKHRGRRRRS